jgi:hypothetical protein
MHRFARLLRPLFWAEAALNLLTGAFAFFLPPLFLAALTSQPGMPVTLLFIQGYGVLLLELACMEGGALLFKQDVVLRFVLCCLLVGDFLHSGAVVIFVLASGRHWTGSVVSALVITAVLVCVRLVWLMRSEMAASQHPAPAQHDEKRL